MLAVSYGMPRVVLLRSLRTLPHLARAIAAVIAEDQRAARAEDAAEKARQAQSEREMYDYLTELKRQQDEDRA